MVTCTFYSQPDITAIACDDIVAASSPMQIAETQCSLSEHIAGLMTAFALAFFPFQNK